MKKLLLSLLIGLSTLTVSAVSGDLARYRATTINKGMNYSWLENYTIGSSGVNYSNYLNNGQTTAKLNSTLASLTLMKQMGFNTVRLPVSFYHWFPLPNSPAAADTVGKWKYVDNVIIWCKALGLKLIIDYHHAVLSDATVNADTIRLDTHWKWIGEHFRVAQAGSFAWKADTGKVFFEMYNEPRGINLANTAAAMHKAVLAFRSMLPAPSVNGHTLIVGSNNYYTQYSMFTIADTNLIYTFHFYEPYLLSHQGGQAFSGPDVTTTQIPFEYNAATMPPRAAAANSAFAIAQYNSYPVDGTCIHLYSTMAIAKNFANANNVAIFCGEWGSYGCCFPPDDSRCRYTTCIKDNLDLLHIPNAYWEWDQGFKIFNGAPSTATLSVCMANAMDISLSTVLCPVHTGVSHDSTVIYHVTHDSTYYVPCPPINQPCCPH